LCLRASVNEEAYVIGLLELLLRNLRTRWVRTILTLLGILVGVAAMVAVNATNNSTLQAINRFFNEAAGQSSLIVEANVSGQTFAEGVLAQVQRQPEVTVAAPGLVGITVLADDVVTEQPRFGAGGQSVPGSSFWLMGRDPALDTAVHTYNLVDGRLLQPGETSYNVVLVDEYAGEKNLSLGGDLAILTPGDGVVRLRIVGLIAKEGLGISNEGAIGIAPLPVVQALFNQSRQIGQIELVVEQAIANDPDRLEALRLALAERLGGEHDVKYPAARGQLVANSIQSYQLGLNFFSVVSLFVGSFLIYNAFAMTVVERTREIGMLRAIGMTRRQIVLVVLGEASLLGVVGAVAGVGFGLLLAQGLVVSVSNFTGQAIDQVTTTPTAVLQAILVGLVVTMAAALAPALQAARVSPLQALRIQGNVDESQWFEQGLRFGPLTVCAALLVLYQVPLRQEVAFTVGSNAIFVLLLGATLCIPILIGPVERLVRPLILLIFGNEGRLGSGNINRAQGRTTLTVAALMIGISMVVGIQGMTNSFEADIEDWMETALGGDFFVTSPVTMRPDVEARVLGLEEVTAVTRTRFLTTRMITPQGDNEPAIFTAIDPATYLDVRGWRVEEGPAPAAIIQALAQEDALLIGADMANKYNLRLGDTLLLETSRGRRPFEIVAIVIDFGGGETASVTGSWGDLRRYFGRNDISSLAVRLAPGASLDVVADRIENEIGRGQNLRVESRQLFEDRVRQLSAEAFTLFDVLGLIGLVVASLGVINTMLMNVLERFREIGGLRSLGMTRRQVRRMIMAEAATIGFIGAIFGAAFGAVLADVFILGMRSIGAFVLTARVPYQAMAFSFVLALIITLLAALLPAYRAGQVNIIEAIKNE
jgi:putative ABC transport system permease protein